jgi:hypothetical protein
MVPDHETSPWRASYMPDLDALLVVFDGRLSSVALSDVAQSVLGQARQHGTKSVLVDCGGLEAGYSLVDLYQLARSLGVSDEAKAMRAAILLPRLYDSGIVVRFWAMTARNRGLNCQLFATMAEAKAWLALDAPWGP